MDSELESRRAFDYFICYTPEDREEFAYPLASELKSRGWPVWFDEAGLKADDSLDRITVALRESRIIVMILSPSFLREGWSRQELKAAISQEMSLRPTALLSVLHGMSHANLWKHSRALRRRAVLDGDLGIPAIADKLEEVRAFHPDYLETGQLHTLFGPDGQPLESDHPARHTFDLSVVAFNDQVMSHLAQHPHLLHQLTPRRFEELVAEIYSRSGYEVELTPASGDGGADVYAIRRDDLGNTLIVVQAKRYKSDLKVEARAVRELLGTVDLKQASAGVLITTSSFQPGAERLAEQLRWRLSLKDYVHLQELLKASTSAS